MERFVKIIKKGTHSSISQKNIIKIEKVENSNNNNNQILISKQELTDKSKNNQEENFEYRDTDEEKNNVNCINKSTKLIPFVKTSEFPVEDIDKLSIRNIDNRIKKADTSLNIPVVKVNGKANPFYQPSIGKKLTSFDKNDTVFCQIVDGLKPDIPFEALVTKFSKISKSNKGLFTYIYRDDKENSTYVSQFKKENIFSLYADNFRYLNEDKFFFISEERDLVNSDNTFKQVFNLIKKYNISYIFASYEGLSGPKADKTESEINTKYLLKYINIPTILFKESIYLTLEERENESSKLNWLFIFDMNDTLCFSILEKYIGFIDQDKDFVHGLTFLPSTLKKDNIENNFFNEMKLRKIKNYSYEKLNNVKEPHKTVIDLVNNGDIHFNFVVIYNKVKPASSSVVKTEKFNSNVFHIINSCYTNVCISSGL